MGPLRALPRRLDALQRKSGPAAFLFAVHKRFGEDRGPQYAALIAYYGLLSVFPLLYALTNVLGIVLRDRDQLREDIFNSAIGQIPVIGSQIDPASETQLSGNTFALVIGLAGALWAGLGAINTLQHAFDTMWSLPERDRPNFFMKRALSLAMLAILGGGTIVATAIASAGSQVRDLPGLTRVVSVLGTVAINTLTLFVSFEVLTNVKAGWRNLWRGALVGGVGLLALQLGGSIYATRVIAGARDTYGTFATVIGLLAWFAVLGRIVLYAFEINVVRNRKLWPRGLTREDPTPADRRALAEQAARWEP